MKPLHIRIDDELHKALKQHALDVDRSVTGMVVEILEVWVKRGFPEPKEGKGE